VVQRSGSSWAVIAKGTVNNVGSKDVKEVVITADCDCSTNVLPFLWVDGSVALERGKGTAIDYLAAGDKETFEFPVAVKVGSSYSSIYRRNPDPPDKLEARVVSFETVK
jgi:hypothetical protein